MLFAKPAQTACFHCYVARPSLFVNFTIFWFVLFPYCGSVEILMKNRFGKPLVSSSLKMSNPNRFESSRGNGGLPLLVLV